MGVLRNGFEVSTPHHLYHPLRGKSTHGVWTIDWGSRIQTGGRRNFVARVSPLYPLPV